MKQKNFTFIDLFSGIGGFHHAMSQLGGECVFASEIDKECVEVYKNNMNIDSYCDITAVDEKTIPKHDVLCAGFPCQAFSKAGKQAGINDTRGTLFYDIARILKHHKTKFIILENVRNLVSHDNGNTWKTIKKTLKSLGYRLTEKPLVLSPHEFGVPQFRERVYILGIYDPLNIELPLEIKLPKLLSKEDNSIDTILESDEKIDKKYFISNEENEILEIWNEFYQNITPKKIGFPIWFEFLNDKNIDEVFPEWKWIIIKKNRDLYLKNKEFIDLWTKKYNYLKKFSKTMSKFEWQAGEAINSIWEGIIQFRPSGIRVKKPDVFSALVALVQTQIVGKYRRRITPREAARLQSFPENFVFSNKDSTTYKQLGNSVNVRILYELAIRLFSNATINEFYIASKEQLISYSNMLIDQIKKTNNYSDSELATKLGMSRQSFNTIKKRNSFGLDLLFKILRMVDSSLKIKLNQ